MSTILLSGVPLQDSKNSGLRTLALAGRQRFQSFTDVLRLRRIHRIQGADPYKESTMRLRDAAITEEDYELWKQHEVDSIEPSSHITWPGGEGLLKEGLCLVTDNAQAGRINGQRLAAPAPRLHEPASGSSSSIVIRCEARHNNPKAENRRAEDFRNIRKAVHLRVGARVILTLNAIWDVQTVPLGLMNGARGVVVAIVYADGGSRRVDGNQMASAGWPICDSHSLPRGLDKCQLPDFVVVHFSSYSGRPLFKALPRTWVPIPCCEVRSKSSKSMVRLGYPLRLAWALTFHKSQGITAQEGTIISFAGSRMRNAVSQPGLAFVGWTRATTWARVAFQSLPPLEDFIAVRLQQAFKARAEFEASADKLHDSFLHRRGITEDMQIQAHQKHLKHFLMEREGRPATDSEVGDIAFMLKQCGVAPVSDSVQQAAQKKFGKVSGPGLWHIVHAFRADKAFRRTSQSKGAGAKNGCATAVLDYHRAAAAGTWVSRGTCSRSTGRLRTRLGPLC